MRSTPLLNCCDGYLPIRPDLAGVYLMSDVQALSSEADVKTPPLRTFRNTVTLCGALFDAAKISIISEPCKHFGRKIFKVPIWHLEPLPLILRFAMV